MKKFLFQAALAAAMLTGLAGNAQVSSEIRDFYQNNVVTNDTCTFWVAVNDAHQYLFNQYNISSSQYTYKVHKSNVTMVSGSSSTFCLYHNNNAGDPQSQCYGTSITLSGTFVTNPGEFNTLFADFNSGPNTGTSMVTYTFINMGNTSDTVCITCVYHVTPLGMTESAGVSLGEPYPNPSDGVVTIPVEIGSQNANLLVTDALGKVTYTSVVVSGNSEIKLETYEWAKGMYTISLCNDHGILTRRKLIVQ